MVKLRRFLLSLALLGAGIHAPLSLCKSQDDTQEEIDFSCTYLNNDTQKSVFDKALSHAGVQPKEKAIASTSDLKKLDIDKFTSLFPTRSIPARRRQTDMLLHPTADTGVLKERQQCIAFYRDNPEIAQAFDASFEEINAGYAAYSSLFIEDNELTQKEINTLYSWQALNKNNTFLNMRQMVRLSLSLLRMIPTRAYWHIVTRYMTVELILKGTQAFPCDQNATDLFNTLTNPPQNDIFQPDSETTQSGQQNQLEQNPVMVGLKWVGSKLLPKDRKYLESSCNHVAQVKNKKAFSRVAYMAYVAPRLAGQGTWEYAKEHAQACKAGWDQLARNNTNDSGYLAFLVYGARCGQLALEDLINAYNIRTAYNNILRDKEAVNYIHTKLVGAGKIVRAAQTLCDLTKTHTPHDHPLRNLPACKELIESDIGTTLATHTFSDSAYLCNQGRVIATYAQIHHHHNLFTRALYEMGALDALRGVSRFLDTSEAAGAPWTYATFQNSETPKATLDGFWNPLLPAQQAVCNTLSCGDDGTHKDMIITGPNGSGKSTNMKAFAYNTAILPQVFGIACAEHAELAPFTHMTIYLDEEEDLDQNLSTFMAEQKRVREIHRNVDSLKPSQRCLIIMDEPMSGTVADASEDLVYETCKRFAEQPQCIALMATHLKRPSQIENATNGRTVNYHVELQEPDSGSFVRTFKLVHGINDWWFHDRDKRSRFISWLGELTAQRSGQVSAHNT